ncbi:MAG: lytic transglycosylase domain-containing protein, partial [Chloroflexi bacterium]|nr:lytic transglycosylase domain-containing protein [Chloroflexota bacterium]
MGIDAIAPVGGSPPVSRVEASTPVPLRGANFASALQRQLDHPRAEIAQVRAEVSSLRNGGALRRMPGAAFPGVTDFASRPPSTPGEIAALLARQATGDTSDPYGWREMSRQIGDSVIGPGFGAMFERQIQQESGFAPDVVTGQRRSSAGAEGIAQLMPQYYPHVNRTDPGQSLHAGAKSMQQYLQAWDGDVRKALASYNAGLGRVQAAVNAKGAAWEAAVPEETRDYLRAIVGTTRPAFSPISGFGGGGSPAGAGVGYLGLGALGLSG